MNYKILNMAQYLSEYETLRICKFLDYFDIRKLPLVCKYWHNLMNNKNLVKNKAYIYFLEYFENWPQTMCFYNQMLISIPENMVGKYLPQNAFIHQHQHKSKVVRIISGSKLSELSEFYNVINNGSIGYIIGLHSCRFVTRYYREKFYNYFDITVDINISPNALEFSKDIITIDRSDDTKCLTDFENFAIESCGITGPAYLSRNNKHLLLLSGNVFKNAYAVEGKLLRDRTPMDLYWMRLKKCKK